MSKKKVEAKLWAEVMENKTVQADTVCGMHDTVEYHVSFRVSGSELHEDRDAVKTMAYRSMKRLLDAQIDRTTVTRNRY